VRQLQLVTESSDDDGAKRHNTQSPTSVLPPIVGLVAAKTNNPKLATHLLWRYRPHSPNIDSCSPIASPLGANKSSPKKFPKKINGNRI
jgi:hypothetical protein